jgi:hypothetical protein
MTNKGDFAKRKPGSRRGAKKTKQEAPGPEICSECNRPMHYYYPPMPPPTEPPKESNKVIFGVVIAIIVIIVIVVLAIFGLFYSLANIEPDSDTQEFKSEVIVADGEYYKHLLYDSWWDDLEVKMNIRSIDGEYFDVYIMDDQQFQNFYENQTAKSFSSYYSKENITQVKDKVKLPSREDSFYLIIDNRDTELTLNDAAPDGPITLDVKLEVKVNYDIFY